MFMQSVSYQEHCHLIVGPAGQLELVCETAEAAHHNIAAIICHPHPLYGGTMQNKVVTTLAKVYKDLSFKYVIRFNFRGVGKSTGGYADGIGEQQDLLAVSHWVSQYTSALWLAGFSFGSYVAAAMAQTINCQHLTCVAPPVTNFDFTHLPPFTCPWVVVQGEQDEVIEAKRVFEWLDTLQHQPTVIRMPEASHFFHGRLLELRANLADRFNEHL